MTRQAAFCYALATSVAFGAFAAPAIAQDTADSAMEAANEGTPIVVIARKREERLLDVPIAITALGEESLADLGANDLSGVQGAVPNVNIVQGRGSAASANFFIRGIGQPDALQTFDPAVGVYVDGVYLSRIQGALLNLFDVQRVEVLRGPQGTLYGKNTIGGAVNIVSKKPDLNDLTGEASFTYGRFDETTAKGYVSVPLAPGSIALSVAGLYDDRDGIVLDPLTGRNYNDRNNLSGRAILRGDFDAVEVLISGDYTRQRNALTLGCATTPQVGFDYNATFTALTPFIIAPAGDCENFNYRTSTDFANNEGQRLDHWGLSGTVNVDLGGPLSLTSITAYRKLRPDLFIDIDATTAETGNVFVGIDQRQFSQELQLKLDTDRLAGVFGLYYLNEKISSHQEAYADSFLRYVGTPLNFVRLIDDAQKLDSYAAFGQLTYDFSDRFSVTAGLRYTREEKQYRRATTALLSSPIFPALQIPSGFTFPDDLPAPLNGTAGSRTFDAWTPMVSASFKPTTNTLLYASASRGFKSGGFNGRANAIADITLNLNGTNVLVPFFEPEKVWTYEVGAKGSFLNGAVTLALAAFHSDYEDFQARVGGGNTGIASGSFPVLNAGKLKIEGIEFEATVKPSRPLTIMASVGYLDADYKEFADGRRAPAFSCNPTGTAITCEPAFAPPITARLGLDYTIPIGAASLSLGGDARFVDKHFLSVDNRPGLTENGYFLGNVYAQADFDRFYLRGMIKNVTDTLYKTDGQEFSAVANIQTVYFGDPRTWQLTVGARF